jgi:O-antigen/teichoic acid export membrane protein
MHQTSVRLTGGRLLARNTLWNLLGQLLPMLVGVFTVPPLVRGLGVDRFGLLSLAWTLIGYFSLFDLGIGRALTKLVADKIGADQEHVIPPLVWTSLLLMLILGVTGGLVMAAMAPWLVHLMRKVPPSLQVETGHSMYLLAVSVPLVTVTAGFRGVLEAQQRFRILNIIRIPMSIFLFVGPLFVLPFSHSLVPVIGVLLVGRVAGLVAHQVACLYAVPALTAGFSLQRSLVAPLLKIGGWMTVSNVVGPVILYADRFVIGALLSVGAVAYYTVPFDVVSRLMVIPVAISGVLFPAFALSMARDPDRTALLLRRGVKYTFIILFPVTLAIVMLAPELLQLWVGPAFSANSGAVLRWLAAGIFMNCVATVPFALLQAIGRPDVTGKVLLLDLPISLAGVWLMVTHFGIKGAAIAWMIRATLEAAVFLGLSRHFLSSHALPLKRAGLAITVAVCTFYAATLPSGFIFKIVSVLCALLAFVLAGWFLVLGPEERMFFTRGNIGTSGLGSDLAISAPGSKTYGSLKLDDSNSGNSER